jgi:hypothetical protein
MLAFKRLCACFKNEILFLEEGVLESRRRGGLVKNAPCRNISFGYLSENPTRGSPVQHGGASILKFSNKSQKCSEVKEITEKSSFRMTTKWGEGSLFKFTKTAKSVGKSKKF